MSAPIFNIQRYSVLDGPGIRTLVFVKGEGRRSESWEEPGTIICKTLSVIRPFLIDSVVSNKEKIFEILFPRKDNEVFSGKGL